MIFVAGDETDRRLCVALKHEFLRCDDEFNEFVANGEDLIRLGRTPLRSYRAYNSYSRFLLHLYEFLMGAARREFYNTDFPYKKSDQADLYISSNLQRLLTNKREAILHGMSTYLENHISNYPEKVPVSFAVEFRRARNVASAHVKVQRATLDLTDFYRKYHGFLYMLYMSGKSWWGREGEEFPDLEMITSFSLLLEDTAPTLVV